KEKWKTISIGLPQIRANLSYQNFLEQPVSLIPAEFFGGIKGDYAAIALQLSELCDIVAVKVGAQGSFVAHAGIVEKIEPIRAAHVIDTTGAGDLWAAGFLFAWSQKRSLADCAKLGSILGAAVVQVQGSVLPENIWQDILANI
ncbi:MAG: PfkB family carbohydrate kinase, partial [Verrucomicrobiota bacterium]|nr:PfkB family carbohydrate kinase [Verrucomicrobiota bacterium]